MLVPDIFLIISGQPGALAQAGHMHSIPILECPSYGKTNVEIRKPELTVPFWLAGAHDSSKNQNRLQNRHVFVLECQLWRPAWAG